ncbi:pinin [Lingula anatina]|uniref:Pinin n=1 Tax=Lingula anatina TaxID=7574 RepID=A0A1S3JF71_LINAN|nr:pinin [Lingula anatina]|eukprot:XP_013408539.1 pinin [Lingula anatina]
MAVEVHGVSDLQAELEREREKLKNVDEKIKKETGREPGPGRTGPTRRVSASAGTVPGRGGARIFAGARRGLSDGDMPPAKRRPVGGAFSRLGPRVGERRPPRPDSGDEEELPNKPTIQSSVVATPKESRTREDSLKEQKSDKKGLQRNRRMFGLLLGTLQRFKEDSKEKTDKEQHRQEILQKLEDREKQEKDDIRKERQSLFKERRAQQARIQRLEQKMEMVQMHEEWVKQTEYYKHFIRTKAKPHLFYMPKVSTSTTSKQIKETAKVIEDLIKEKKKKLDEELEALTAKDENQENEEEMEVEGEIEKGETNEGDDTKVKRSHRRGSRRSRDQDEDDVEMAEDNNREGGEVNETREGREEREDEGPVKREQTEDREGEVVKQETWESEREEGQVDDDVKEERQVEINVEDFKSGDRRVVMDDIKSDIKNDEEEEERQIKSDVEEKSMQE